MFPRHRRFPPRISALWMKSAHAPGAWRLTANASRRSKNSTKKESIASTKDVLTDILREPQRAVEQANAMSEQLTSAFLDDLGATVMMVTSHKVGELTHQHAFNVMILTMIICKGLGVNREIMSAAGVGALLHDIGKSSISKTVLHKPERNASELLIPATN